MSSKIKDKLEELGNVYENLGLKEDATLKEIKKAHRKMSMLYHPDKNPDKDASFFNLYFCLFLKMRNLLESNNLMKF